MEIVDEDKKSQVSNRTQKVCTCSNTTNQFSSYKHDNNEMNNYDFDVIRLLI